MAALRCRIICEKKKDFRRGLPLGNEIFHAGSYSIQVCVGDESSETRILLQVAHGNIGSVTDILAGVIYGAANTGVALLLGRIVGNVK